MKSILNKPMKHHTFDIASAAYKDDPFPTLERMRQAGPIIPVKLPIVGKVWMATTYQAVNELLRDHKRFVREARNAGKNKYTDLQWWLMQVFRGPSQNMLAKDEPDHRRLRSLVEEAFLRRSVEGMRPRIAELADEILDETIEKSPPDAVEFMNFSRQFPLAVICELLGFVDEDRAKFTHWASGLAEVNSLAGLVKLLPNMFKINRYLKEQFLLRREQPGKGLMTLLVQVEQEGKSLSQDELVAMGFLLLFAGHETTTHLIGDGLLSLLDHPEQRDALMSDWSKGAAAVDEMMRYNSPVQFTKPRLAAQDVSLYGQDVKRGQYLIAMLAAANTDPAHFENPEQFDISRSPNHHVGFGAGVHICLGLKLARIEAELAMNRVLTRFPNLELAIPRSEVQWYERIGMRSMRSLPIRLRA